jgi:hypothetical protein
MNTDNNTLWELMFWDGSFDLIPTTIRISTDKNALRAYYESLDRDTNLARRYPLVEDDDLADKMLEQESRHWTITDASNLWLAPLSDK